MPLLVASDLTKTYTGGTATVSALAGVSFALERGDFVALMGPSGCGKSTLLHLCGAMDRPSSGSIVLEGRALATLPDDELTLLRRDRIGFVFQFFNLLPTLTLGDNIALPCLLAGMAAAEAESRAARLAERVGIGHRLKHYPQQVSGGEMQRAAIARALVHGPRCWSPTSRPATSTPRTAPGCWRCWPSSIARLGVTILLATHAAEVAAAAGRVMRMRDGRFIEADVPAPHHVVRTAV